MKPVLLLVVAVIVLGAIILFVRSRIAPTYQVSGSEFSKVLAQLSTATSGPVFAAFMFSAPDQPGDESAINIQFSLEEGRPGFDWVLLAPRNIVDEQRYLDFARSRGYLPRSQHMNDVRYWRVEDGDLAHLCRDVVQKMYGMPQTATVGMIVEGFDWTP